MLPPLAPKRPITLTQHGITRTDEYAWLRAENWQEVLQDPKTLAHDIHDYLEAENAYTKAWFRGTGAMQKQLLAEMRGRIKEDDSTPPARDGAYFYATRYRSGGEYPLFVRAKASGGVEEILLDGEARATNFEYFDIGDASHSDDHRLFAWSADTKGSEFYTIFVRDLSANKDLADAIPNTNGDVVWTSDASAFYYIEIDAQQRPRRVKRHILGTDSSTDALIYEEALEGWFLDITPTQSGRFVVLSVSDHETSEAYLLERNNPNATPQCVRPREIGLRYEVEHHGDRLLLLTNKDGADDCKVMTVALDDLLTWQEFIPYRTGVMILDIVPFAEYLIRLERSNALPRIVIHEWASGEEHTLKVEEEVFDLDLNEGYEFDTVGL
jgi:oligopeptidase B